MNSMLSLALRRTVTFRGTRTVAATAAAALAVQGSSAIVVVDASTSSSRSLSTKVASATAKPKATPASKSPPPPPPPPPPPASTTATPAATLAKLASDLPFMDVVRYAHKNRVWSLQHVHYYSEALAIGLVENGLQPGDVVLSWLPNHFSEQMVLQFACAKSGLILYTLDPLTAVTDRATAQDALAAALELSKANVLISQEAGNDVNYIRLVHELIPELRIFDYTVGMPFVTPRYPHLRLCIQTGFDQDDKHGWLPLRHMVVPSDNLSDFVKPETITSSTPLAGHFKLNDKGIPTAVLTPLTNSQVLQSGQWPTFSKILKKEYHEVEGVGVVF